MITCQLLNKTDNSIISTLTDCKIPKNTMIQSEGSYKLKFMAVNPNDTTMNADLMSTITLQTPSMKVFIDGGDRSVSTTELMSLTANVEPPNPSYIYEWTCKDLQT